METPSIPYPTKVFTVSEFNSIIDDYLSAFGTVAIEGEIADFRISQDRWVFFDIKDDKCNVSCFAVLSQLATDLEEGESVIVTGTPGLYTKSGRFSLRVREVYPQGEGALKKAFEILKNKLQEEGLFDISHKQDLPRYPKHIAIVTSEDAAAYTDILRIINNRWNPIKITLIDARVQGPGAEDSLSEAIEKANKFTDAEVLILSRGGGSLADLQAFNHEKLCRTVFASKIPIISAVGHERDTVLTDLVADRRASTPSNAAEIAVPDKYEFVSKLDSSINYIFQKITEHIEDRKEQTELIPELFSEKLKTEQDHLDDIYLRFQRSLKLWSSKLNQSSDKLKSHIKHLCYHIDKRLVQKRQDMKIFESKIKSLDIHKTLERGFCLVSNKKGLIKSAKKLKKNDKVNLRFHDNSKEAQIT